MPDRSDADQEGITLTPSSTTHLIAEAAARQVVTEHIGLCPFRVAEVETRVRALETGYARLTGFMLGAGTLGGAAGAAVAKIFGG
jgi:hypothetical protein